MLCSTSQRWLFIFKHSQEAIEAAIEPVFSFHFVLPGMHLGLNIRNMFNLSPSFLWPTHHARADMS